MYSATGEGRVPFINALDVAAIGAVALTSKQPLNRDVVLTGPATLSYDEVASIIGAVSGRRIEHVRLSEVDLASRHEASGLDQALAQTLAAMDVAIARGSENRTTDEVWSLTGNPPGTNREFAEDSRCAWHTENTI